MKRLFLSVLLLIFAFSLFAFRVSVIEIEGMITAGQLTFLERELIRAEKDGTDLFVIQLNTQGGLVDVTFKINEAILNAPFPVAVHVSPTGAIAASAGAFIVLAADIAAMSPATSIGAAQPLNISAEGVSDAGEKTSKFLANHARSLAEANNRPDSLAASFVEDNLTLTSTEALDAGIIDYIASSLNDLLFELDGKEIEKNGVNYLLETENAVIEYRKMRFQEEIQQVLSNPQFAFLLLSLGLMGIYFGLSSPGTYVPEVLGFLFVILGVYGIGLFDTNTAGIVLLIAGVGLIIAEIFTSGFGILGLSGILALFFGALLLPHEPLMGGNWYRSFIWSVLGIVSGLAVVLIFVVHRIIYSRKHPLENTINLTIPIEGIVVEELNPSGMIKAKGELWQAQSYDSSAIEKGVEVKVIDKKSAFLIVKSKEQGE